MAIKYHSNIRLMDNNILQIGTGGDLKLEHTGTHSYIYNTTGNLEIINYADDKDIILKSDDGSGGVTAYLTLDGSVGYTQAYKNIRYRDNVKADFGDGGDLDIYHDGSNSYISQGTTGDLYIRQTRDDGDMFFQCDDGSGGNATYITLDGSAETTIFSKQTTFNNTVVMGSQLLKFADNGKAYFGDSNDLQLYHDATDSYIHNDTGDLNIECDTDDGSINLRADNGSGGLTTYLKIWGQYEVTEAFKNLKVSDNVKFVAGGGVDLQIYHDGTNSYIHNNTGTLRIEADQDDGDIEFRADDNSGGLETYMYLDGGNNNIKFQKDTNWIDNEKALFGTGTDFQIYHDGSNNYIKADGLGHLYIQQGLNDGDIIFQCDDGSGGLAEYFRVDGGNEGSYFSKHVHFIDSVQLRIGNGNDAAFYHDASDTYLTNGTGDFYIQNTANDKDVIFRCDDGSGGNTAYITLDGSQGFTTVQKDMYFADAVGSHYGASGDLAIKHDGSNSYLQNNTGDFYIKTFVDDGDIIFQSDDGSGGVAEYFRLDGGASQTVFSKHAQFVDGQGLLLGSGTADLQIIHDGTDSYISNDTGDLYIKNKADDKDIIFQSDDGSGGVETYFYLDGSAGGSNPRTVFPDNSRLCIGTSEDLNFSHDATDTYIQNETGDLYIKQRADDGDISFNSDDGSGGTAEYFRLDGGDGATRFSRQLIMQDNVNFAAGSGVDLRIYHNGTDSYIHNDTGDLRIENDTTDGDIVFRSDDGSGGLSTYFRVDGGLQKTIFPDNQTLAFGSVGDLNLYHDASNSFISNGTGDLYIINGANDEDIIFQCDDGSGGLETYFFLDGSANTDGNPRTKFPDNSRLMFGAGDDMDIFHNGTNSFIRNNTTSGDLIIQQSGADKDIIFKCDDGSGGETAYITLDGSATTVEIAKATNVAANITATKASDARIEAKATTAGAYFRANSAANNYFGLELYHDTTAKWFLGNYVDHASLSSGDFAIVSGAKSNGDVRFKIDSSGNTTFAGTITATDYRATDTLYLTSDGDNSGSNPIVFRHGSGGERMRLTSDGKLGISTTSPASKLHVDGTVQVGVDDTGYDVKFYGATTGASFLYDESEDRVTITGPTDEAQLELYTISGGQPTVPQLKIGRSGDQYWGAYTDDRIAHLVHRQDETSGTMSTYFEQWDSNTSDALGQWVWRYGNGSGGSMAEALTLTQAGDLTLVGDIYHSGDSDTKIGFSAANTFQVQTGGSARFTVDNSSTTLLTTLTVGVDDTGYDVKFFGATSGRYMLWDESDDRLEFTDNAKIGIGSANDLQLYHDGSDSYIRAYNNDLIIMQDTADKDIVFKADDGSGGQVTYFFLDGSSATGSNEYTVWPDSSNIAIGTGKDLQLYHNGSTSFIYNNTGDLQIVNSADDSDILFRCDDGSGGLATYFSLDGGLGYTFVYKKFRFNDSVNVELGGAGDMKLYHDGTDSRIENSTGDLQIQNFADDKDIKFLCDDGSGGTETYFMLDGSNNFMRSLKHIRFDDNASVLVGSSSDLSITHNGTNSVIANSTGDLQINQNADDGDLIFQCDDGSGGTTEYFKLDGGAAAMVASKSIYMADNKRFYAGGGGDLAIYHDGSNTNIENITGNLNFYQKVDDQDIIFLCDDGSGGNATYFQLDGSEELNRFYKNVLHQDSVKGMYGTGLDLQLYHDGSNSYIDNITGDLKIRNLADDEMIMFQCDDGSGGVETYFQLEGASGGASPFTVFPDNSVAAFGSSHDLRIYHSGTSTFMSNYVGNFYIDQNLDDGDIVFRCDDGSGGVTAYLTLDGSEEKVVVNKPSQRTFGKSSTTDGDANGDIVYFGGTTSMEVGKIYYLNSSGNWALTDADAEATAKGMLAVALGSASDTDGMLIRGFVTLDHDPGSVGHTLFLHTTAGQATITAPSGNGDIVRVIGYLLDSSNGQIYFNPDGTFIEVTA